MSINQQNDEFESQKNNNENGEQPNSSTLKEAHEDPKQSRCTSILDYLQVSLKMSGNQQPDEFESEKNNNESGEEPNSSTLKEVHEDPKQSRCTPILDYLQSRIKELYMFKNNLFENCTKENPHDKENLRKKIDEVILMVKEKKEAAIAENKALYYYLLGKTWCVQHPVDDECIHMLKKSLKLNPNNSEGWNLLGECLVHLKMFSKAKHCFITSLKYGKSKQLLRNLAIIMREVQLLTSENVKECLEAGIEYAKEAVQIDYTDGKSWAILGNAYLSLFCIEQEINPLSKSIISYGKALKDTKTAKNPYLHFNRGVAFKYAEMYTEAMISFEKSLQLDPAWDVAKKTLNDLVKYLTTAQTLFQRKGQIRTKQLQQMTRTLDTRSLGLYSKPIKTMTGQLILEPTPLSKLQNGLNCNKVVCGKVVCVVYYQEPVPYTFCMVDKELNCIVVSVYNLSPSKGPVIHDSVAIPEPYMTQIDATYKNQKFQYPNLRVYLPLTMAVNKKCLSADCICQPHFLTKLF
ncbi:Hypothetical protein CINCED_3A019882 [Cinara cedri]|nr:Hypothetical protein CINCED_3A019882 [Cinara cedri]